jgi:hypothetical protein
MVEPKNKSEESKDYKIIDYLEDIIKESTKTQSNARLAIERL